MSLELVVALLTMIGVFAGPLIAENWRLGQEVRREHFRQVKIGVQQPMLDVLTAYYLPVLRRQRPNVGIIRE